MTENITIDGTAISTLGFHFKNTENDIAIGKPRKQGSGKEDYTSENLFLANYYEESPEPKFTIVGSFSSIEAAETALYTLYGLLVQVGEHTFSHTDETNSVDWKGIMKQAKVDYILFGNGIYYSVTVTTLKTDGV